MTELEDFLAYLHTLDRSPHTLEAYQSDVKAFFNWLQMQLGREVLPTEVTPFDIQKYRDHLQAEGRKPGSINRRLAALRAFFHWAVESGVVASNPANHVKVVRQVQHPPKALSKEAVYRLQRTAAARRQLAQARANGHVTPSLVNAIRDEAILNLLLYTGIRVSELVALRLSDVQIGQRSRKVIVHSGKGRKYREVPLHLQARKALQAYLDVRPQTEDDHLFVGQRGPLHTRGVQMRVTALGEAAGVPVTPHVLRHTLATRLLREGGADLVTTAALLGHENVTTTAVYTQPGEQDLVAVVDKLE